MTTTPPPHTAPTSLHAPLSRARRWAALAVLTASLFVITMDMTILHIAIPEMSAELQPSSDQQLWIIDIYSLLLAGLLVSFSAIADRWGRKKMLLIGYVIFGAVSILVLLANSAEAVIAIRALLGIGGAMIMPITLSLIRVIFTDPKERAAALSIWAAVSMLGAAGGPLIGGLLLEHFSWHAAFLVHVPLMVVAIVAGAFLIPESRVPNPGRWDAFAVVLSFAGMTLLVWAIKIFGKEASLLVPQAITAFAVGAILLAWFVVRCLRSDAPLLDLSLFRSRIFSAGIIAALGSIFAMIAIQMLIAQWLQLVNGASPIEAGVRMLPAALGAAASALLAPLVARAIGARAVLAGGIFVAAVGLLLIGVQYGTLTVITVLVALALVGAGTGSLAIGSAMIMMGTPEAKAGNAGALEETSYELGAVLGIAVIGTIAAMYYRSGLAGTDVVAGLDPVLADQAKDSLGAANAIAGELQLPDLAHEAGTVFTDALQTTGLVGGCIMIGVAALVFFVTPKGTNVTGSSHT
ncbi:MFS transporter [Phytoactinopolyspora limicola]|uniref:MFS transporter n=1 Tax=Phytoactinopolyspora limicola TaxID=2715536 RepID=UPI00140B330C|nr:MFS transporter [Phytoactinopolyspora limicola]